MAKTKIILDCDPGHDDAIAILLAAKMPEVELLGISVSSGNQTIEKTSRNALSICDYLGIDVPVCAGEACPLIKAPLFCPEIHGETGLDGFPFPDKVRELDARKGYQLIIDLCLSNDRVTIVATGSLTNLALALTKTPSIKERVERIVLMGGSIGTGNITPYAEFNIFVDPEAADIVFRCGLPVYMCGLDVTRKVLALNSIVDHMRSIGGIGATMFSDLMATFNANQESFFGWVGGAPLHDPVTIVSIINPNAVRFDPMDVKIDLSKKEEYGRTVCVNNRKSNIYCATDIDVKAYWDIVEQAIRNCK